MGLAIVVTCRSRRNAGRGWSNGNGSVGPEARTTRIWFSRITFELRSG